MRDINSALGHQLDQVPVAKFVGDTPTDAENDDCASEAAATKQGRCVRRRRLIHTTDYQPNSAFAPEPFEEGYADAGSAVRRLFRLGEKPPGLSPEDNKAFPLRTGFRYGETVYIVITDALMFEGEMNKIAKELEAALRQRRA
jgi:hypothetical protein